MKEALKMNKFKFVILTIVMCPLILCGCWDYEEVETFAIVAGVAIDKDTITNKYIITTEIVTAETIGTASTITSELFSSEGDSIFNASTNMTRKTGLQLFWSDAEVVIISETLAADGMIPIIDWLLRDPEPRPDIMLLIAKGNTAAETLKTKSKLTEVASFMLSNTFRSEKSLYKLAGSRLWSFIDEISSESKATTVATVKNLALNDTVHSNLSGVAIFKADKLVGYLNATETLYMLMIKNKLEEGLITLSNVSGSDTGVTLEIYENRTKLTPLYTNGKASLIIDIYQVVSIMEVQGTKNFVRPDNLKILETEAEKKIQSEVQNLISKLQKTYKSDVLGFANTFKQEKPKVSKAFKDSGEDIFGNIKTQVNVHVQIKDSGVTNKATSTGE